DSNKLTVQDVYQLSNLNAHLSLSKDKSFRNKIKSGADLLDNMLKRDGYIYGVTTGYGDCVTRPVPLEYVNELPLNLTRFHGCGLGEILTPTQTRAVLVVRLASLCRGASGVTIELLEMLETLINRDILPIIPSEGSVGASGDLTPLS